MTNTTQTPIRRAVLSVSDKTGLVQFAKGLNKLNIELLSTGGTAKELKAAGLKVTLIEDYTGTPEALDGRVKTLHPKLYAGILAARDNPQHRKEIKELVAELIDLVCVNLYPFAETAAAGKSSEAVIENIDIGGPTLIRAAAKNHRWVASVTSPEQYEPILEELQQKNGELSASTRQRLANDAFAHTARYDSLVAGWFGRGEKFPVLKSWSFEKAMDLRYGENPHQQGAYYVESGAAQHLLSSVKRLQGKELSLNNLLDLDTARFLLEEFDDPACAIIKHNNPCGCAEAETIQEAYDKSLAADEVSAYGGVFLFNRLVDKTLAEKMSKLFIELIWAPSYEPEALEILQQKKNLRVLEYRPPKQMPDVPLYHFHRVRGGMLLQDRDAATKNIRKTEVVTKRAPTKDEWRDLAFAWKVCKHVRSNAIVLAKDRATNGIGIGQTSRVDSVAFAAHKATRPLKGAAMASDAFFPFADGPEIGIKAGVTAIVQPGGSIRDDEVIAACDRAGAAMVFTRQRHFRH